MLALFLFTIVAESLSGMIIEVVAKKLFDGFPNGKDNIEVNLLQYLDDTLFIRKATNQNVVVIKSMLTCLELISSLKVNFLKSSFGAIGAGRETLKCFAEILHYRLMFFPFMYLGLPVGANPRKECMWRNCCRGNTILSFAMRVCLIKSILSSLPLFFFCSLSSLLGLRENRWGYKELLWGKESGKKKICWVKWEKVCVPKRKGELGVKDLGFFNESLLAKWCWALFNDKDSLWKLVIELKYEVGRVL